jgi:hypothetical protein
MNFRLQDVLTTLLAALSSRRLLRSIHNHSCAKAIAHLLLRPQGNGLINNDNIKKQQSKAFDINLKARSAYEKGNNGNSPSNVVKILTSNEPCRSFICCVSEKQQGRLCFRRHSQRLPPDVCAVKRCCGNVL